MQLLENLELTTTAQGSVYACRRCKTELGPAGANYKELAAHYDESINFGEPAKRHAEASPFVLRHYLCGSCGTLFEVDMVLASDPPFRSIAVQSRS
jgi:DNA-directed RNA polymerase subunit RPC12/RpoP